MHILDLSQFYVPECRKIKSYFSAKTRWLNDFSQVRHTIIAPWSDQTQKNERLIKTSGIRIPFLPGFRLSRSTRNIEFLIKSIHPDCIEVSDPFQFARATVNIKQESNVTIGAFCHFDPFQLPLLPGGFFSHTSLMKQLVSLYSQFDLVFVTSAGLCEKFREAGLKSARYQSPGVDTAIFHPCRRDTSMKDRLGLKEDSRLLVYAEYTSGGKKQLKMLSNVMKQLPDEYHLLVISSQKRDFSADKISNFYYHQNVHAPEMLATMIASCDLLLHPELHQNYPLSALEGLSSGLPVVGFRSGCLEELLDEKTGRIVERVEAKALAQGIQEAFENNIQSMGEEARKQAEKHYDWNCLLAQWRTEYISLLASKGNYPKQMH